MMRFVRALFVVFSAALAGQGAMAQQPPQEPPQLSPTQARFAFVVGNDAYEGAELATAANDAALVAEMLKSAGFDVTGARNLDQGTLRASYREFVEKVAAAGSEAVAFVYVSGYGVQSEGENYFIPPGAQVKRAADVAFNGVRLSDMTRSLGGLPAQARIMVFDLAYASPFAREGEAMAPGLAIMEAGPGDLIAFNAAPGVVAPAGEPPYGAYAQALAEMARVAGTPIADVFASARLRVAELTKGAQAPWHQSRIERPLVMFERGADAPPPAVSQAEIETRRARPLREVDEAEAYALSLDRDTVRGYEEFIEAYPAGAYARNVRNILAARREAVTWRRTVQVNTAAAYWSYLDRYPRGPNAAAARARLARLRAALDPPASYEVIDYDVAPPTVEEITWFIEDRPRYFEIVEAPIAVIYIAPRPLWWRPPPPPIYVQDSYYFLPMPRPVVVHPVWVAPPVYVAPPPQPIVVLPPSPGVVVNPYVAVPTALAAGIVAGSIINRRDRLARPNAVSSRPFLPPVAAPPRGRPQTIPAALRPENVQKFQQRPRPVLQHPVLQQPALQQPAVQQTRPVQRLPEAPAPLVRPGQARPGQARPEQARPEQARPEQARPEQAGPGQARPEQARPQQGLAPAGQQAVQPGAQQRPLSPQERQRQLQMQRQEQIQSRREQELQRQQQLRTQQQTRQQQQMQQQRTRQQILQEQQQTRQEQLRQQQQKQQQRRIEEQQSRQKQFMEQQNRQQIMRDQQRERASQQQQQRERASQQQQQRDRATQQQQQQRQQQIMQQQRQQQMMQQQQQQRQQRERAMQQQQQQRQQQIMQQQQRQQQLMQQQRQQQMMQQRQQQQQQRQQQRGNQGCGRPGQPPCR